MAAKESQSTNQGEQVTEKVDPTANVLREVAAAVKRLDDMRALDSRRLDAELNCVKELNILQAKMLDQRAAHLEQMADLRANHSLQINDKETARVNAIRQVDVLAVSTAADNSAKAIQALAATTTQNADTLRAAVAATASTLATQLQGIVAPIVERLTNLEKAQYESRGRSTFADPAQQALIDEVRKLSTSRDTGAGKTEGTSDTWKMIAAALGMAAILLGFYSFIRTQPQPVVGVEPPVRVAPQP